MAAPSDPSQSVPAYLLPHIHLVNTYGYPATALLNAETITKWLNDAPKIARDTAPFYWTYLEAPEIGTVLLTWRLNADFASDGYNWVGGERFIQQEVGSGMILETYYHSVGYRYGEQIATRSRRRFRLVPPKVPGQNQMRAPDPSLWIVHWGPIDSPQPIHIAALPFDPHAATIMTQRVQLQRNGQIQRKEFMLSDRVNWPQLPFFSHGRQPMYMAPNISRGVPQQMAYPPPGHAPTPGPPSKRARHGITAAAAQQHAPHTGVPDDDEDTHPGDAFDHATPREISIDRYIANHEWMEEVLSSPYRIGQINPADLGLGLKGSLSSMTEGIFEAQGSDGHQEMVKKPYTGHLDSGLADEFRKRVEQKIASEQSEIEKLTARHEKLIAKLKSNVAIRQAEQDLRYADQDRVPGALRLDVHQEEGEEESGWRHHARHRKAEDIVSQVEASVGRPVQVAHIAQRVQDGGYQEPAPEPVAEPTPEPAPQATAALATPGGDAMSRQPSGVGSHHSGGMFGDSDIDMDGTAAGLLDQMHTGMSSTSTPLNSFPTPQPQLSAIPSAVATPANMGAPSPQPHNLYPARADAMEGVETGAPDQGTGSDWVMVPKGGISPFPGPGDASSTALVASAVADSAAAASKPGSSAPTPADQNDFSSLGDINDYHLTTGGDAGDDLDLNMDMEDSAFGDAFHGVDASRESGDGNTPADGGL